MTIERMGAVLLRSALLAVGFVAVCAPARADLLVHHDVPSAIALTIAQGTLESCAAKGYAVSVVVVDRDWDTIVAIMGVTALTNLTSGGQHDQHGCVCSALGEHT